MPWPWCKWSDTWLRPTFCLLKLVWCSALIMGWHSLPVVFWSWLYDLHWYLLQMVWHPYMLSSELDWYPTQIFTVNRLACPVSYLLKLAWSSILISICYGMPYMLSTAADLIPHPHIYMVWHPLPVMYSSWLDPPPRPPPWYLYGMAHPVCYLLQLASSTTLKSIWYGMPYTCYLLQQVWSPTLKFIWSDMP